MSNHHNLCESIIFSVGKFYFPVVLGEQTAFSIVTIYVLESSFPVGLHGPIIVLMSQNNKKHVKLYIFGQVKYDCAVMTQSYQLQQCSSHFIHH